MKALWLAAVLAVAVMTAGPVNAERAACGSVPKMFEWLGDKYGESAAVTFEGRGGMVVGFVNRKTGTWTMVTVQGGRACARASGKGRMILHKTGGKGNKLPVPGTPA